MPTDINLLLGMFLIELNETTTVTALVSAGVVAGVVFLVNWWSLKHQEKISSINLSLKMLEYWDEEKHKYFADMVELVYNSKVEKNDSRIRRYLSIWEEIAVFCNEGTITKTHMKEFFKPDLQAIRNNDVVYRYLKEKCTETTYHNLWELIKKHAGSRNS